MAQIKNHREEVSKKFKVFSCIQSALSDVIFTRVMACETAKEAWDKLKEEFQGSDKTRKIRVINLRREFETLRMKDSETIEEFSNKLMKVVNQIRLLGEELSDTRIVEKVLRLSLRLEKVIETALQAKFKGKMQMQNEGKKSNIYTNFGRKNQGDSRNGAEKKENFPPCKFCKKTNHKEDDCWFQGKKQPLQCRYGQVEKFCRVKKEHNKQTQKTNVSEVEDQEELVFTAMVATRLDEQSTWFLDSGCTNHMKQRDWMNKAHGFWTVVAPTT
ncbi:uncharacterized protein LOC132630258 [Lycium barbarum]|uniref:uncharacterized protein LOC132630258 n=1 Tax=Lycium barbarum TaxID=112863 RepID=UPI00293F1774|nr:uncharacterized protein LOC132630258 [Lycium barbarum]